MDEIKSKIKVFLTRYFRNCELTDDDDIFEQGFVNSLFAMQLVMFIEKEFAITIEIQDMDLSNFRTINQMVSLIQKKTTN
ncbi:MULTISPECIES: acyl carrier protein [Paenibacillus]|uniref:Acyl carrier protein n=1 Tax=Paenibacillus cucumis (ex Kampfer et al. 2016) TaxID=1776858 RepID=A0ABS7KSY8_9BACL|nr:acyl carrier protein [Paenibacillus cucumis (ex Kampfer et al. 2016)]MBY0207126.1 acyl carrier protein [Paenibacillus cucumis (ex Kampfer et al. 2016)]MDP9698973.1 acyl carrier protein [Paenibacillus intestini]